MSLPFPTVRCTWRPGSTTHVCVEYRNETTEVPVERVTRLFGRVALEALSSRGRFVWRSTPGFALYDL